MNRILLLLTLALVLSSCGLFSSAPEEKPRRASTVIEEPVSQVQIEEMAPTPIPNTRIEIIWSVPPEPVDGFVIHYGESPDRLSSERKVDAKDLEKYDDPARGRVYRYILENVIPDRPVFVALSAFSAAGSSDLSEIREIKP